MKNRIRTILIIAGALALLQVVLVPQQLGVEPSASVAWATAGHLVETAPPPRGDEEATPVYDGDWLAWVSPDGERVLREPPGLASSVHGIRGARWDGRSLVIQDGIRPVAVFESPGAPYYAGSTLVTLSPGGDGIQVFDSAGGFRWRLDVAGQFSAAASGDGGDLFLGLVSGEVSWRDSLGAERLSFRPGSGRVPVVYGLHWVSSRKLLAVTADLDPQSVYLYRMTDKPVPSAALVESVVLPEALRHPVWMGGAFSGSHVAVELADGVGLVDLDGNLRAAHQLGGRLVKALDLPEQAALLCLVEIPGGARLVVLRPDGRRLCSADISAPAWDMARASDGRILVATQGGIEAVRLGVR